MKLNHILSFKNNLNARLNFNQFYYYMKQIYHSDEISEKVEKIQKILGKYPSKILETIVETNESSVSGGGSNATSLVNTRKKKK